MRILMTARTFLPESRGGSENHAFQLSQFLLAQGHTVGVFYRLLSPEMEQYQLFEEEWAGLSIFKITRNYSNPQMNPYPFYDRQVELVFERVLAQYKPDLVHMHHFSDLSASLPATARRHRVPTVLTLHDFWPMCFMSHLRMPDDVLCPGPDEGLRCVECLWQQWQQGFKPVSIHARIRELGVLQALRRAPRFLRDMIAARLGGGDAVANSAMLRTQMAALAARNHYMRRALQTCDRLIASSRFLMAKFVEWGIPESRLCVLYNSVPASLRQLRAAPKAVGDPIIFGFMGSLYPPKGAHLLVEAFQRLNPDQAELHIWGSAPIDDPPGYVEQLHKQAHSAAGAPKVVFEGGFPPEKLPDVLRQIDLLVVPSVWYENNPLVIQEAFAAGIPVLAGDVGGMAELVEHDRNGLLFRIGDVQDLVDKMRLALDPERLARCRAGITPPWSHEELGAEIEQIYKGLLK